MNTFIYKNTTIHYTEKGKGTALIFLHGFLGNKEMWQDITPAFEKKHRVITIDLLGHGSSDCLGYVHTMEDQADMVFALVSLLKLRKVTLIGHSMGGYIALAFAELYPDHVKNIVLINSTSLPDSQERKINRDRAIEAVKKNSDVFIRIAVTHLFSVENQEKFKNNIDLLIQQAQQTPLQGIIAALEGMKIRQDREVLLHFGPYPKMMIAGKNDTIVPIEEVYNQTENTEVQLHVLDCGHMAMTEVKDEVVTILQNFIKPR